MLSPCLPRRLLVDDERPGAFHVISRCVRRAFLCGDQAEHRRGWAWSPAEIAEKAADPVWIDTTRRRLRSLSWFMKNIKERLARRANRDDGCTGHFWGEHGRMPRAA